MRRDARTTRSAPRSPLSWSSPCAHRPRPHPTRPLLVHKSAPAEPRNHSSQPCNPVNTPKVIKVRSNHRHGATARNARNVARSDPTLRRTRSAIGQGLRCEPRRPRRIQLSSQTSNNAAATVLTSADTPKPTQTQSTAAVLTQAKHRGRDNPQRLQTENSRH